MSLHQWLLYKTLSNDERREITANLEQAINAFELAGLDTKEADNLILRVRSDSIWTDPDEDTYNDIMRLYSELLSRERPTGATYGAPQYSWNYEPPASGSGIGNILLSNARLR